MENEKMVFMSNILKGQDPMVYLIDNESANQTIKSNGKDPIEIYLDRSLHNYNFNRTVLQNMIKYYQDLYKSYREDEKINIEEMNHFARTGVNELIDDLVEYIDALGPTAEDIEEDLKENASDVAIKQKIQQDKELVDITESESESESPLTDTIWLDVSKIPLFLGKTIEERLTAFIDFKNKHNICLYDTSDDTSDFENMIKEKNDYIRKLSITIEKYSILALHLKSISHEFQTGKINNQLFINKILQLSNEYK